MKIITAKTMKDAEEAAVQRGLGYDVLMENAGAAVGAFIKETLPLKGKTAAVICGAGNNGGDGFVIARKLFEQGAAVSVILANGLPRTEQAGIMYRRLPTGVAVYDAEKFSSACLRIISAADITVDAIIGSGLNAPLQGFAAQAVNAANQSQKAVRFAVDVPSGLLADGGFFEPCFSAHYTVTFEAVKLCHVLFPANRYCGAVRVATIGIDTAIFDSLPIEAQTIDSVSIKNRERNTHKGNYGTALSVTGSYGMAGACVLASTAALRMGVGIMKTAIVQENYVPVAVAVPESVLIPCESTAGRYSVMALPTLKEHLKTASALLIGCGLGVTKDTAYITKELCLSSTVPVIVDADGINSIASDIEFTEQMKAPLIMTPHPGEMSRLINMSTAEIEADRIGVARRFATLKGVYLVLKGAYTVIAAPDGEVFINISGNAGMATGGTGDMLAGMILSLLAQGYEVKEALKVGVRLHALSGDAAKEKVGEVSLLPRDMLEQLPSLLKNI